MDAGPDGDVALVEGGTSEVPKPIFIIGSPRSGTSILTWALGQHPNILPLEETVWFGKVAADLESTYFLGGKRELSQLRGMGISLAAFYEAFGNAIDDLILRHGRPGSEYAQQVETDTPFVRRRSPDDPKTRWVDGTPEYSFYAYDLLQLFPEARFIHLLRDVQSVVRSLTHFDKAGAVAFTEGSAYEKWLRSVRAAWTAERAFGSDTVLRIRHRDLVAMPEATIRRCLDFVGEAFSEHCLEPLEYKINSSSPPPVAAEDGRAPATAGGELPARAREAVELSDRLLDEAEPSYEPTESAQKELESRSATRRGAYTLPTVGPVRQEGRASGFCSDLWIDGGLEATFWPRERIREVTLEGALPEATNVDEITLFLTINGHQASAAFPTGQEFSWSVPHVIEPYDRTEVTLTSSVTWCPKRAGISPDSRDLVILLKRILFSPEQRETGEDTTRLTPAARAQG
jgi:hypothetical protein